MADTRLQLDVATVAAQIAKLKLDHPELEADADLLAGMIDGETDLNGVLDRIVDGILEADTTSEAIELRVKNLRERQDRFERRARGYRSVAMGLMRAANTGKVQLTQATLNIAHRTRVNVYDVDALPQGSFYLKRVPAPDTAIRALIEAGGELPGARIDTLPETLTVRTK